MTRSAIWMDLIRTCKQVVKMYIVGMRRKSGASRNRFLCSCSPCAEPDCTAKLVCNRAAALSEWI